MKIKELIEKLKSFDPEMLAVVGGFDEEGYADIQTIEIVSLVNRETGAEVIGEYRRPSSSEKNEAQKALHIDH